MALHHAEGIDSRESAAGQLASSGSTVKRHARRLPTLITPLVLRYPGSPADDEHALDAAACAML